MNMLDWIKTQYPEACRETSFAEDYQRRRQTGGTHRAAIWYARSRHPEYVLPMPDFEYFEDGYRNLDMRFL